MTLYNYIQKRLKDKRRDTIVQDLLDDMKRDKRFQVYMTGEEIVSHIRWNACLNAWKAFKILVHEYRRYCKTNNLEIELFSLVLDWKSVCKDVNYDK